MTMPDLTIRPIDVWPEGWRTAGRIRRPNPFRSTYDATLKHLGAELDHLNYRSAHLQLDVEHAQLRQDGQLRHRAQVNHPGVILTIDSPAHGVLVYPCDTFEGRWSNDPPDWQINLRAIALGLEALRKVERYGIAERGQQYAGYKALGAGGPVAMGAAMTVEDACRLIAEVAWPGETPEQRDAWAVRMLTDDDLYKRTIRQASRRAHPDAGGDPAAFRRLTEARDLLEAHRG